MHFITHSTKYSRFSDEDVGEGFAFSINTKSPCGIAWLVRRRLEPLSPTRSDLWDVQLCSSSIHCTGNPQIPAENLHCLPWTELHSVIWRHWPAYRRSKGRVSSVQEFIKKCRLKEWEHMEKQQSSDHTKSAKPRILQEGAHNWRAFLSMSGWPAHNSINWCLHLDFLFVFQTDCKGEMLKY